MRRTFCALVFTVLLAGCGTLGSSLPYHSASAEDSMGMTVEQYAVGRLPSSRRPATECSKPGARSPDTARQRHLSKRCHAR